jgi:hypothetical protein
VARAPPAAAVHTPVTAAVPAAPGGRDWMVASAAAASLLVLMTAGFASGARLLQDVEARWPRD